MHNSDAALSQGGLASDLDFEAANLQHRTILGHYWASEGHIWRPYAIAI